MLPPLGGQLAKALVVLDQETGPNQKRLRDLANRARRQSEPGSDNVEPGVALGQDAKVMDMPDFDFDGFFDNIDTLDDGMAPCDEFKVGFQPFDPDAQDDIEA